MEDKDFIELLKKPLWNTSDLLEYLSKKNICFSMTTCRKFFKKIQRDKPFQLERYIQSTQALAFFGTTKQEELQLIKGVKQ